MMNLYFLDCLILIFKVIKHPMVWYILELQIKTKPKFRYKMELLKI